MLEEHSFTEPRHYEVCQGPPLPKADKCRRHYPISPKSPHFPNEPTPISPISPIRPNPTHQSKRAPASEPPQIKSHYSYPPSAELQRSSHLTPHTSRVKRDKKCSKSIPSPPALRSLPGTTSPMSKQVSKTLPNKPQKPPIFRMSQPN